ncbi:ARM repeat-containing protein [Armillaria solidipes]|uniref:ARM repeat-containing protein n=1 Tax=Armillaria solidipes TaxID=1076256 RepID=A0A2H3C480_9AGAR|nr:ARM repeat-containing protein [Armillaria solidipes]
MSGSTSEFVGFKKHEVYYIKGGDVHFLVGECMFRVHRYFFERESSKFQQMFGGPTYPGMEPEGSSPDTAFRLSDITAEDFAHFLWIFYNPRPSAYDASTDVWIAILRTACKWSFPEVKALAIKELGRKTITLVDPTVLYENHKDDPSVLALLYAKLCSRDELLTMEQSVCLGIETTVRIFHARERLRSSSLDRLKSPLPNGVDLADVIQVIDEVWGNDTNYASGLSADTQQGSNRAPTNPGSGLIATLAQSMLEPVAPLQPSANRWDRRALGANDPGSPDVVDRKVKGLLNKLTMKRFDSISDKIIAWANKSEKEKDSRTLIQVIRLVFENAIDQAMWSEMYARLCRKMMEQISPKVQGDGIKNNEGKPIAGGQLFRKYLLNRCHEDFERGWMAKEATVAAAASKAIEDQAAKAAAEKKGDGEEEITLYSEEYYAAQKARRQSLGLIKFIGELFKVQMLTERIIHECVKKLLGNVENPEEEEIESLCTLLTTVGKLLDTTKARAHMDVYFSRMKELTKSLNVSSRMQFMLQDVLGLCERKWVSHNAVAAPTTIAQIHEAAAKEKAAQEKESYQRQMSMSRGGSRWGGERGELPQVGASGWAVAGGNSAPRPPSKASDLSKFGQISNKDAPLIFGPLSSIYAGKKDSKRESVQRMNSSSQNMFSMLNNDSTAEATPKEMLQRKRLVLAPRSKPVEGQENAPATAESEASSDEEVTAEPEPIEMSEKDAKKKIEEDTKEFSAVRNLDEAEVYFTQLPAKHHPLLVDKLISFAVESKEADAQLVAQLSPEPPRRICSGFAGVLEFLDDIVIDAPMAFKLMAIMMKGPAFDDEQRIRLALKTDSAKLLGLLS